MFTDLHVETAPILDTAVEFESTAQRMNEIADRFQQRRTELLQSSAGAASEAAGLDMQRSIDALYIRAGKLTRNAGVLRKLVALYDQADLDGARSFGP
ncbi:hypothetical protein [Microbacterium sp. NC79]|uniref:hypothetical protein n=1 Tax=Microbacterium sp. NC79 TaxID=2851009 RepID=UPI001C2C8E44|nr:hypothetical protein [Microbacterium sp. NC79]MBV0894052.1 hypothetical protein [Microbacterium sp. NC79]